MKTKNELIAEVRKFVETECKKPTSKYGFEPYHGHFVPTVTYAIKLANELGAEKEIVEIAAWLHDIGSIIDGRENHQITGAKIAEEKLKEFGYPAEKIELVKKCILNHRGSKRKNRESLEEKIIAEADALSNFDNLGGIFKAALIYEGLNQKEAQKAVLLKLQNKWKGLHFEESKRIIKSKYEAAMLLLETR